MDGLVYRLDYFQQLSQRIGNVTVREQYDLDRHDERLRSLLVITTILSLFYFSYTFVDIFLLPDITFRSILLRALVVGPITVFLFFYYKRPVSIRRKELAGVLVVCMATVVWCAVLLGSSAPGVLDYFYAGLVFILVITIVITPPFEYSVYGSLFVFVCLYTTIWFLEGVDSHYILNHLALGLPTFVLTLIANYRFSAESLRLYMAKVHADRLGETLSMQNAELEQISRIDPLTGLANRRALVHYATMLFQQPTAHKHFAVVIVDIDYFKPFNDHYGHAEGDNCLQAVASAIRSACGPEDLVCRFGGEEFLVLHSGRHLSAHGAWSLAEHIRSKVANLEIAHQKSPLGQVTVSAGGYTAPVDTHTKLDEIIIAADNALYEAKREGRNQVRISDHNPDDMPYQRRL